MRAPTLVIHNRDNGFLPLRVGQRLAASIPDASLTVIDDPGLRSVPSIIGEFLGEQIPTVEPERPTAMTAILFLDIADSTALTTKLGDAAYRERERELDASLRSAITESGGSPVEGKVLGDGGKESSSTKRSA